MVPKRFCGFRKKSHWLNCTIFLMLWGWVCSAYHRICDQQRFLPPKKIPSRSLRHRFLLEQAPQATTFMAVPYIFCTQALQCQTCSITTTIYATLMLHLYAMLELFSRINCYRDAGKSGSCLNLVQFLSLRKLANSQLCRHLNVVFQ